jgi:aspartate racemase
MKRLGLLGGMSWESSAVYYQLVNRLVADRLGGLHSADCLLRSVDFAGVEELQRAGEWEKAGELLAGEARSLETAGAELLVLCTNTMHKVAPDIESAIGIPLVHIADATAEAVRAGVGVVNDDSRDEYRRVISGLASEGAEAVLLGCTEIDLLITQADSPVPIFDTTELHARRAVDLALAA